MGVGQGGAGRARDTPGKERGRGGGKVGSVGDAVEAGGGWERVAGEGAGESIWSTTAKISGRSLLLAAIRAYPTEVARRRASQGRRSWGRWGGSATQSLRRWGQERGRD